MHLSTVALVGGFSTTVSAQITSFWIEPPNAGPELFFGDNPVYAINDKIQLRWQSSKSGYGIYLWQQSMTVGTAARGDTIFTKLDGGVAASEIQWTVDQQAFNLEQSNVFYFSLGPDSDDLTDAMTSHYFNLTEIDLSSTSSTATSSATGPAQLPTSTASLTPATITSTSTTALSGPAAESARSEGGDPTLKVGIGVGLGLGIPLLLIIAWLAVGMFRKVKRRPTTGDMYTLDAHAPEQQGLQTPHEMHAPMEFSKPIGQYSDYKPSYNQTPIELPIDRPPHRNL